MERFLGTILALFAAALGCDGEPKSAPTPSSSFQDPNIPQLSIEELKSAPPALVVAGRNVTTDADLWRDFMPSIEPEVTGSPLMAVILLTSSGDKTFPAQVAESYLWVMNGNEIWSCILQRQQIDPPDQLRFRADSGPNWNPGTKVDVVVGVRDTTGKLTLVLTKNVEIIRTE